MMRLKNFLRKFVERYSLFAIGLVVGAACMFFYRDYFVYKFVVVSGATQTDKIVVHNAIFGKSVFIHPASQVEDIVSTILPTVSSVNAYVALPNRLRMEIRYKKSIAAIRTDKGYIQIAEDGTVIQKDREYDGKNTIITNNFPILHHEYQRGQRITLTNIIKAVQAIRALRNEGMTVDSVDIDSVDMIACKTRTIEVIFSQTRNFAIQTHEMRQIVKRLRLGDLKVEAIDLRFDKPIVRTKT